MDSANGQHSDHDLLTEIHVIVQRLDQTINGNGQEGMRQMVTRHDQRIQHLEQQGATPRQRAGIVTGVGVGTVALVLTVARWLGFEVPS